MQEDWCGSIGSVEEIKAKALKRQEAAAKRERAMAYALTHQVISNNVILLEICEWLALRRCLKGQDISRIKLFRVFFIFCLFSFLVFKVYCYRLAINKDILFFTFLLWVCGSHCMTWLNRHSGVVVNIAYLIYTRGRLDSGNSTLVFLKISKWLWVDYFECSTSDLDR